MNDLDNSYSPPPCQFYTEPHPCVDGWGCVWCDGTQKCVRALCGPIAGRDDFESIAGADCDGSIAFNNATIAAFCSTTEGIGILFMIMAGVLTGACGVFLLLSSCFNGPGSLTARSGASVLVGIGYGVFLGLAFTRPDLQIPAVVLCTATIGAGIIVRVGVAVARRRDGTWRRPTDADGDADL